MKTTSQKFIAIVAIAISLTSCKEDHTELITQLTANEHELQTQDSVLKENFKLFNSFFMPDSTKADQSLNPMDSTQQALISNENELITSLDSLIKKNQNIVSSLTENKINNKEAEEQLSEIKGLVNSIKLADDVNITQFKKLEEEFSKTIKTIEKIK